MITNKYFITTRKIPTYIKYLIAKKQSGGKLPSEYQELEYLETTGTQYINTGVSGAGKWLLGLEGTQVTSATSICLDGSGGSTGAGGSWFGFDSSGVWTIGGNTGATTIPYGTYINAEVNFIGDGDIAATINGEEVSRQTTFTSFDLWKIGSVTSRFPSSVKIFYAKFIKNNELIFSGIPCYRKLDNIVGLYDLISNTFLINQGTGKFSYREDIWTPELEVSGTAIYVSRATCELNGDEYTFNCTGTDMAFGSVYTSAGGQWLPRMGTLYDLTGVKKLELIITNNKFDKNYITFYDENQQSVSFIKFTTNNGVVDVPEGAKYCNVRFGINLSTSGNVYKTKVHLMAYK